MASGQTTANLLAAGVPDISIEAVEYYHLDALGSVRAVTDNSGMLVRTHDYKPFGEELTLQADDQLLFTGKQRDFETGLDLFGARYYRAELGRFTTVDPGSVNGDRDLRRRNAYSYALDNPLAFIDPDGRDAIVVNYSKGGIVSGHALGHQAVVVVGSNGSATLADFGPVGHGALHTPGAVNITLLQTQLQFDNLGAPTQLSLLTLAQELQGLEQAPAGSVRLAYFKMTAGNTSALYNWIHASAFHPQWRTYRAVGNNCGNYVRDALSRWFEIGVSIPNFDYWQYRVFADAVFNSPRAEVTATDTGFRLLTPQERSRYFPIK